MCIYKSIHIPTSVSPTAFKPIKLLTMILALTYSDIILTIYIASCPIFTPIEPNMMDIIANPRAAYMPWDLNSLSSGLSSFLTDIQLQHIKARCTKAPGKTIINNTRNSIKYMGL